MHSKGKSSVLSDPKPLKGRQMISLLTLPPGPLPFQLRTNSTVLTFNSFQILPLILQKILNDGLVSL